MASLPATAEMAYPVGSISKQFTATAGLLLPAAMTPEVASDPVAAALPGILERFAKGQIDRTQFSANCNVYFSDSAIADFRATLKRLGAVKSVYRTRTGLRGGMTYGAYRVVFATGTTLVLNAYTLEDGKIEQLLITGEP